MALSITWRGSPNKDSNRKKIDRICIHWFGVGNLTGADSRFKDATSGVSAHYGVSAGSIYQWVREEDVAYHAGKYAMNQRSIGIEHDATTTKNASEKTYETSAILLKEICQRHNIPLDRKHIIGHNQVISTTCPGTLDIDKLIRLAGEEVIEVDKHFVREHSLGILEREPTDEDYKRWGEADEPTAHFITEIVSERKKLVEKEIEEFEDKINTRIESLADAIGKLTKEAKVDRKVVSITSSKTSKIEDTTADLVQEDIKAEKRFGLLRERMDTLERGLQDLVKYVKGVIEGEDSRQTEEPQVLTGIRSWLVGLLKSVARLKPRR